MKRQFVVKVPRSLNRLSGMFYREFVSQSKFSTSMEALRGLPEELETIRPFVGDGCHLYIEEEESGRICSPDLISLIV